MFIFSETNNCKHNFFDNIINTVKHLINFQLNRVNSMFNVVNFIVYLPIVDVTNSGSLQFYYEIYWTNNKFHNSNYNLQ